LKKGAKDSGEKVLHPDAEKGGACGMNFEGRINSLCGQETLHEERTGRH